MSTAGIHSTVSAKATAACALSSTIKHLGFNFSVCRNFSAVATNGSRPRRLATKRNLALAMSSYPSNPLEVCVKASTTTPNRLGDCPFCQRVLLTMEEKHVPYEMKLIDLANKPDWFLQISPEGKVPVAKLDEKWIPDSDVITQLLEEKFPEPPVGTPPEKASIGSKIFPTFISFFKSKYRSDGREQALLNELSSFNGHIKENGPFINGQKVSAADFSLGPKLYHLEIALGHYKQWSIPDSLPHLKSYMQAIFSMDSFVKTRALPEDVIAGWRPKVMG
ncbi:glutathione S-transferase DHAR3, chloroplastic-like [Tripterygium wilfordii]|uniref:glutathione S-transferase DHAR3, chloroplastic-like n=1 Tax=Tripterygium wilfordii TaxID=458696 RepID=UPI0018F82704|nr:glutathione S-transferase DHAR3, chloroplastic-like [Tripterygium wilfordii]